MAEEDHLRSAAESGVRLEVLFASAPDADAAERAARMLSAVEEVSALVGGFGTASALALGRVASERGIPFLNIGSPSESLRVPGPTGLTFHVEASASMYLRALARALPEGGGAFVIHPGDDEGQALLRHSRQLLAELGRGEEGSLAVAGPGDHLAALDKVRRSDANAVLLLLDWRGQLDFMGRYEAEALPLPAFGFPWPVTQTRDFLASLLQAAPATGAAPRVSLWEPAGDPEAVALDESYLARWGVPLDPPGWAAYFSVRLLEGAATAAGGVEGSELASALSGLGGDVDSYKGAGVEFRPADRQLLQPLYLVRPDPEEAGRRELVRVVAG
jgi:ABC-type branched-subunit amino acid transport system substrate-binding protein